MLAAIMVYVAVAIVGIVSSDNLDKMKFETNLKAAEQGHASAQVNIGVMYINGQGVPKNHKKALEWFRRAAEQGHAKAQSNIAFMYKHGRGILQNNLAAYAWAIIAASNGERSLLEDIQSDNLFAPLRQEAQIRAREIMAEMTGEKERGTTGCQGTGI